MRPPNEPSFGPGRPGNPTGVRLVTAARPQRHSR